MAGGLRSGKKRVLDALQKAGFSKHIVTVEHIGSTSVPGLGAKPVVDFMIGMHSLADLGTFPTAIMTTLGYVSRPFSGVPNPPRLLFSKYATAATNVHVFVKDESRWHGHLAVRDYLRTHPKVAARYQYLKHVFAERYGNDIKAYGKAKRSFLDSVERVALGPQRPTSAQASTTSTSSQRTTPVLANILLSDTAATDAPAGPSGFCGGLPSDATGWQTDTWYTCNADNAYIVSPDQNPLQSSTVGWFVQWDGTIFSIVGRGLPSFDPNNPDAGTLLDASDQYLYNVVIYKDDGTSYTEVVVAPDATNPYIPDNAQVIANTDGTILVLYNNDGSQWTDGTGGGDSGGSDGGTGGDGSDGGFDGGGGDGYENPY